MMADPDNISASVQTTVSVASSGAAASLPLSPVSPVLSLTCVPERTAVLSAETARVPLLFDIRTAPVLAVPFRPPLNLCLLIDRSGSMDGAPLEAAKRACAEIVDRLGPNDFLSVVAFEDGADVVVPARRVAHPALVKDYISRIAAGSRANLYEGIVTACGQVASVKGANTLNRVLLLTDGEPSAGPREDGGIVAQVGEQKMRGITVSTIGLGPDFREELLVGIARRSGGNYYAVRDPEGLGDVFRQEMDALLRTTARSLRLRLHLPRGASVRQVYGQQPTFGQRTVEAVLPDMEGGTGLLSLWELELVSRPPAPYRVAVAELLYDDAATGKTERVSADIVLDFANDVSLVPVSEPRVSAEVSAARAVRALEEVGNRFRVGQVSPQSVRAEMERVKTQMLEGGKLAQAQQVTRALSDLDADLAPGKALAALLYALDQGRARLS